MKMKIIVLCVFLLFFVTLIYKFASTYKEDVKIKVFKEEEENVKKETKEEVIVIINLNTATFEDLVKLNGIGGVIADRIIAYRDEYGFKNKEDIKKVKGIGDKLYEKIKKNIEVEAN